ncbi:hypothetical protein ACFSYH_08750 [Populibacterium corticicola]|uniref:Uncharacterized protein n=1 Tax=Populibacterium corticicola TaxID=1812826 RepID=A0ABW5XG76_9MICO
MDFIKRHWVWFVSFGTILLTIITVFAIKEFMPSKKVLSEVLGGAVIELELFEYPYAKHPPEAKRTVITDPVVISEITKFFDGTPVKPYRGSSELLLDKTATAFRMHLADGSVVEATHIFAGNYNTVLFWPDGAVYSTEWGRPYEGFYDDLGVTEQVSGAEVPVVNF